ncbi:MAG: hypothetical protein OEZ06_09985 [Myxococcales bacterium]|nr:hypothetical protein [Myxococcales bacterium]
MYALRAGKALVIAPIPQLGFLVTALLSFVFMREPVSGRKSVGLALSAAAIGSFAGVV